jgi:hypothetical protein
MDPQAVTGTRPAGQRADNLLSSGKSKRELHLPIRQAA